MSQKGCTPHRLGCIYLELRCGAVSVWGLFVFDFKDGKQPGPGNVGRTSSTLLQGGNPCGAVGGGSELPPSVVGWKPIPQEGDRAVRLCCRDRVSLGVRGLVCDSGSSG